jgi:hypothetical protein
MELRAEIQIQSMIKAMTDVVLPAVDTGNQLAQEQARLIIGMLSLMAVQLPLQFRFDRDELHRLLDCAAALRGLASEDTGLAAVAEDLAAAHRRGRTIFEESRVDPADLTAAVRALRAAVSELVRAAETIDDPALVAGVERIVLDLSREQLLRDRSLLLPQGWELDPGSIPSIESLLEALTPTT